MFTVIYVRVMYKNHRLNFIFHTSSSAVVYSKSSSKGEQELSKRSVSISSSISMFPNLKRAFSTTFSNGFRSLTSLHSVDILYTASAIWLITHKNVSKVATYDGDLR